MNVSLNKESLLSKNSFGCFYYTMFLLKNREEDCYKVEKIVKIWDKNRKTVDGGEKSRYWSHMCVNRNMIIENLVG